jgi:elongation factor G
VERGTTASDFDPLEKQYQHSFRSSILHSTTNGTRVHLIDTPGFPTSSGNRSGARRGRDGRRRRQRASPASR